MPTARRSFPRRSGPKRCSCPTRSTSNGLLRLVPPPPAYSVRRGEERPGPRHGIILNGQAIMHGIHHLLPYMDHKHTPGNQEYANTSLMCLAALRQGVGEPSNFPVASVEEGKTSLLSHTLYKIQILARRLPRSTTPITVSLSLVHVCKRGRVRYDCRAKSDSARVTSLCAIRVRLKVSA